MLIYLPVLVSIIGILVYALADGKISEAGRLAYAVGLLVACLEFASHVLKVG